MGFDIAVRVPATVAPAAVTDLNETNALLGKSPGKQELTAKVVRLLLADSVQLLYVFGLVGKIDELRGGELHSCGQLVSFGPRENVCINCVLVTEFLIQVEQC